jgi:recombination DNA repair RAD52 pathway protein
MTEQQQGEAEAVFGAQALELVDTRPRVELTKEQVGFLMSPLHEARVAHRSQGGKNLSYVEAYDIKATLIRVFGFGGFSAEVVDSKIVDVREGGRQGQYTGGQNAGKDKAPQVIAQATVRLTIFGIGPRGEDAVYSETAIGANSGADIGETADNAIKTAASDALKRCAIYLGTQFGLSLYDNGATRDIIRRLYQPEQAAMLAALQAEAAAAAAQQPPQPPAGHEHIARALGGRPLTDEQRQALAGEEPQA